MDSSNQPSTSPKKRPRKKSKLSISPRDLEKPSNESKRSKKFPIESNSDSENDDFPPKKRQKKRKTLSKEIDDFDEIKPNKSIKISKRKLEEMLFEEAIEDENGVEKSVGEYNEGVSGNRKVVEEEKNDDVLIKTHWKIDVHTRNDLIRIVFDEIALEGLDGITLEALWLRLSIVMNINPPKNYRELIWDQIKMSNQLEFYELQEARGKLVIFNRFQYVDVISGHLCDVENVPEDIYPYSPLPDDKSAQLDIYGSCATFNTRKLVSERIKNLTLKDVERLGNKIVIVANQNLRNEALGLNETKSITKLFNQQYSLLERIGRSRKLGESSTGNTSLHQFGDSKIMYYLRKVLLKNNLITKQQLCFQKNTKVTSHTIGLLFHLTRFYFHFKTKKLLILEQIVEMLKKKPNLMMEYVELRAIFGADMWTNAIAKMMKGNDVRTFLNTNLNVNYREIYPNATKKEWMGKCREKKLKVIQLSDPYVNVSSVLKEIGKDDGQKDDDSDDEPLCEGFYNKSCYHQVYDLIYESGEEGLTQNQISLKLGMDTYVSRLILKSMEKENIVYIKHAELGFRKVLRFVSYQKKSTNAEKSSIKNVESEETLDFLSEILEVDKKYLKPPPKDDQDIEEINGNEKTLNKNVKNLKGEYEFIKKHHKQLREHKYNVRFRGDFYKIKIDDLEDGKKRMEEILRNEHDFIDMKTSIEEGVIKKYDLKNNFGVNFAKKSSFEDNFDVFNEIYKIPSKKETFDYNLIEKQTKMFLDKSKKVYFNETQKNKSSIKILIDYLTIFEIPCNVFIEKIDDFLIKFDNLTPKNQIFDVYKEFGLDDDEICEEKDEKNDFDEISLIENFENEEFFDLKTEDLNEFKENFINQFENEEIECLERLKNEVYVKKVEENDQRNDVNLEETHKNDENIEKIDEIVEIHQNSLKDTTLKELFIENDRKTLKEFNLNDFNNHNKDFQIEKLYGETILINYFIDTKNQIEIIKVFSKPKPVSPTLEPGKKYFNKHLSQRALKRINYILENVDKHKIITDVSRLANEIKKNELENGLIGSIDIKTFNRLLEKIIEEGFMRSAKIILKKNTVIKTKKIIWLPNIDYDIILEAVCDQMKMPFLNYCQKKVDVINIPGCSNEDGNKLILRNEKDEKMVENVKMGAPKFKSNKNVGKFYGFLPKNCRLKLFHEFIFYLTYLYEGEKIDEKNLPKHIVENNLENCDLYQKEISWKMFIPPPPKNHDRPNGWILFMDVLFRLPLCIFTKIFNVVYVIPELLQLLNHPIKKYLLLSQIPIKIRNACFYRRKHILSLHESLQRLCYQGLLQFGEQRTRNKEHLYIYLNKNATVFDTTSSKPGYHQITEKEYPKLTFRLETEEDVENYWNKVWNICLRTRLGIRYSCLHQTITIHRIHTIPDMIQACQPRSIQEVEEYDVGHIPGDGRGPCGFDSNSWMFVKKNWVGTTVLKETRFDLPTKPIGVRKKQLDKAKLKPMKLKQQHVHKSKVNQKINGNNKNGGKNKNNKNGGKPKSSKTMIVRKIKPRPPVKKVKRIDDLDTSIKTSGLFTRSRFTQHEDNTLIIISYAINYLFPAFKKRLIAFTVIRDLMHRLCPKNYKKTSTAYNNRLRKFYKFNAPENNSYIVNLEADHFVRKYFSKLKQKIMKSKAENMPQEHLHIALIYLVAYCVDSFEKKNVESKKILDEIGYVDYLEDIDDKKIEKNVIKSNSLYEDINNTDDILIDTVKSLIHSSIGIKVDDTIKILHDHLDKVYQKYSEEILRKAVSSLREHNLIKTSISFSKKSKLFNTDNILQSSFLYSFKQVTKFNEKIYLEAFSVFNSSINVKRNQKFNLRIYQEGFGIGFSELQTLTKTKVNVKIDDKQFILDPSILNHDYLIKELNSRYKRLISKKNNEVETKNDENDLNLKDDHLSLIKEDDNTLKNLDELAKCIKNEDFDTVNEKMSDLAFLLTKGLFPELEDEDDRLERLSKHFLTMNPEISYDFNFENLEKINDIKHNLKIKFNKIEEVIQKECILNDFNNEVENDIEIEIVNFIELKGNFGASGKELKIFFDTKHNLKNSKLNFQIINRLIQIGIIHRFGIKSFRFVHNNHKNDWTVDIQEKKSKDKKLKRRIKPLPWLKINGKVNKPVLIDWLFAICSFCISNPLITFSSLCKRFNFLKPVDIYVLLEYLEIFDCLEIKCYEDVGNVVTLNSNPFEVKSAKATCLDNFDDVYIEMDVLAVTKLGAFTSNEPDLKQPFEI